MNYSLFVILVLIIGGSNGWYINGSSNLFQHTRNISCKFSVDLSLSPSMIPPSLWQLASNMSSTLAALGGPTTVWKAKGNLTFPSLFDFCFVVETKSNLSNGTEIVSTVTGGYFVLNFLEPYIRQQCSSANFSLSATPIGYGTCQRFPYQVFTSSVCICSTNNCNIDYASCVANVQANQSPPPPPPASSQLIVSSVHQSISCDFNIQGATYDRYAGIYTAITMANIFYNISGSLGYRSSISAACVLLYNVQTGDFFKFPTIYEGYSILSLVVLLLKATNQIQNYVETSTSVAIRHQSAHVFNLTSTSSLQYFSQVLCICTTNNCNAALASCAPGMNISQITTTTTAPTTTGNSGGGGGGGSGSSSTSGSSSRCFSGRSHVQRNDGSSILMRDVRIGDYLLVDESTYSPVIAFLLRQDDDSMIKYLQIFTEETTLEMTPTHLILMRRQNDHHPPNYLQASKLRPGDNIFIVKNNQLQEVSVVRIENSIQSIGAYAPLTMKGTLIVDDVLVSCYAEYEHQSIIHFFMFPLRFWYSISSYTYEFSTNLHPYIQFWLNTSRWIHFISQNI